MSTEDPQNLIEKAQRLQTINDITFEVTDENDSDPSVLTVFQTGEKAAAELLADTKKEMVKSHWWLNEYWQKKGMPKEQISIRAGDLSLELYNYGLTLSPSQLEELKGIVAALSQVPIPNLGSRIKYILIDNLGQINEQEGEQQRGEASFPERMIRLFPRAISSELHRVEGVSGLAGTVAHEFGHIFINADSKFADKWRSTFGWEPGQDRFRTTQPERCVTTYAQYSEDEDICESLAAVLNNPSVLDRDKLVFLRERWLKNIKSGRVKVGLQKREKTELPLAPKQVKYKVRVIGDRVKVGNNEQHP